jgi:hypothetical protein
MLVNSPRSVAVTENPSADRFGPPPEQAQREREWLKGGAKAGSALGTTSLFVGIAALRIFSHSRRGWVAGVAGLLAMIGYGVQYVLSRQRQDARDGGPDPYTPPTNITR